MVWAKRSETAGLDYTRICATARTLWGSLYTIKRGLFAFVSASLVPSVQRKRECLCVCGCCSRSYSSWSSLITGVSPLTSRTDSMLQRYRLIGVNGISALFGSCPGVLFLSLFLFRLAALREAPIRWAYFSSLYPPYGIHHQCIRLQVERERPWRQHEQ